MMSDLKLLIALMVVLGVLGLVYVVRKINRMLDIEKELWESEM